MAGELCGILRGLVMVYELAVAEEPGSELLAVERYRLGRGPRGEEELRAGIVEEVERFVTNTRPASEGSYHDAAAAWRMYESLCIRGQESPALCERVKKALVERMYRALVIWGGAWSLDTGAVKRIVEDLEALATGAIDLYEYIRRHRGHLASALAALHLSAPDRYPPMSSGVCVLICRALGGKRCSCERMGVKELHRLYTDYAEKVVPRLLEECGSVLEELERLTGKTRVKLLDEALWLVTVAEERAMRDEAFRNTFTETMQALGAPLDPLRAAERVEEELRRLLAA